MAILERGSKHLCPDCATKFYDMMRTPIVCPKCGAKPPAPKAARPSAAAKKSRGTTFVRYR